MLAGFPWENKTEEFPVPVQTSMESFIVYWLSLRGSYWTLTVYVRCITVRFTTSPRPCCFPSRRSRQLASAVVEQTQTVQRQYSLWCASLASELLYRSVCLSVCLSVSPSASLSVPADESFDLFTWLNASVTWAQSLRAGSQYCKQYDVSNLCFQQVVNQLLASHTVIRRSELFSLI